MPDRQEHQQEVHAFLKKHLSIYDWRFPLPNGSGKESYFVHGWKRTYFVKVGVQVEPYLAMAEIGLTPPVILYGQLDSGLSIIVQTFIAGRKPSRTDYRERLTEVADLIRNMHNSSRVKAILQAASSSSYQDMGWQALDRLHRTWERHKDQVPTVTGFVEDRLEYLAERISLFSGEGLVASHGDICNANWLIGSNGKIYVIDFDLMSVDDPSLDLGALLWWYFPPELRERFLNIAGYIYDDELRFRMQIRMAMHCLNILLPRERSFDAFDPAHFSKSLRDFRAVLEGRENPEGYS